MIGRVLFAQHNPTLYMPLGDSYTIGEGLPESGRFPNQLVVMAKKAGKTVKLGPNPSKTGWTTQDLIDNELPLFVKEKPQISTLLIGVNDWVQGVSATDFRRNFKFIITEMISVLKDKNRLIVVTIPDFSATPSGAQYGRGRDISKGIAEFNQIIEEESKKAGLVVVDIYWSTQEMKQHPEFISEDGLHPSAKEYEVWANLILPFFIKQL